MLNEASLDLHHGRSTRCFHLNLFSLPLRHTKLCTNYFSNIGLIHLQWFQLVFIVSQWILTLIISYCSISKLPPWFNRLKLSPVGDWHNQRYRIYTWNIQLCLQKFLNFVEKFVLLVSNWENLIFSKIILISKLDTFSKRFN